MITIVKSDYIYINANDLTNGGSKMAQKLKDWVRERRDSIIKETEVDSLMAELKEEARQLAIANPRWKPAIVELEGSRTSDLFWLSIDHETVARLVKVRELKALLG